MKLTNVKLIFQREVRDQLRDRRMLFMIFVLPMLLYPLLGLSFFQMAQFLKVESSLVRIVGLPSLAGLPPLVEGDQIDQRWLDSTMSADLLRLQLEPATGTEIEPIESRAEGAVHSGEVQAVLYFPPNFETQLQRLRQEIIERRTDGSANALESIDSIPQPTIYYNGADDKSRLAHSRIESVLRRWVDAVGERMLRDGNLPVIAARPFEIKPADVAPPEQRQAALWSKILPFVLFIWALTGAFYPAIDLCAGEKERGTLETLLSSPAERSEIVTGKLLTIMLFSVATSVFNLVSMGVTGAAVIPHMPMGAELNIGLPPPLAGVWLFVALIPVAALFSALCIALASFARSNKEGQYYLMPLLLVSMPLMVLPMAPGVELTLGNSLIPLTGLVLLLRSLLEGQYLEALPFVPPVVIVTLICCVLAVRWAIDQFNKESVLFRESERVDLGHWLRHLMRDRQDTPSAAEALFCGVLILVIQFFMSFALPIPTSFSGLAQLIVVSQVVVIATPALLMAVMLTRSPTRTLLLHRPPWLAIPFAILLAVCLHPAVLLLQRGLAELYPMGEQTKQLEQVFGLFNDAPYWWLPLILVAVVPAICEELAFRGFILSGLRHLGHRWRAILISAVFFGITHQILQQSIAAAMVGAVIGYLAVQTGSIFPGMLFHATHNALVTLYGRLSAEVMDQDRVNWEWLDGFPELAWLFDPTVVDSLMYRWPVVAIAALMGVAILWYFMRLPPSRTAEEALQETIDRRRQLAEPAPPFLVDGSPADENGAALHGEPTSQKHL